MHHFRAIIVFEFKKLLTRRTIFLLAALFILLAFFCWDGISDFELIMANKEPFRKMEQNPGTVQKTIFGCR